MAGIFGLLMSGAGVIKDQYYNLTSLLLPGNGTDGKQNRTFLDSSGQNGGAGWTITPNGNATQGTFSPFSQTGWGNYFGGNAYLSIGSNSVLAPGTGDFTLEGWINLNSLPSSGNASAIFQNDVLGFSGSDKFWFGVFNSSGTYRLQLGRHGTSNATYVNWTPTLGVWYHVAATRSSGTTRLFIDGVSQTVTGGSDFSGVTLSQAGVVIGAASTPWYLTGYISNLRYTVGAALYTASFTPITSPLTTTSQNASASQVEILTCQSNRFLDNSSNSFALALTNSPSVVAFSPFAPTQSYSAAAVGGSGYFDGTGDYLELANNSAFDMGTGNFTAEFYVYTQDQTNSYPGILSNSLYNATGAVSIRYDNTGNANKFFVYLFGASPADPAITSGTYGFNQWVHVALVRDSSTSLKLYINGVLDGSQTIGSGQTVSFGSAASTFLRIGRAFDVDGANAYFAGTVSNVRIVKGQALASGNFTPPSAPVTASAVGWTGANAAGSLTGTVSLLLNFTNAGVVDATAKNVLETVGNAQISTTQSKWGGGSIYLDGTSGTYSSGAPTTVPLGSGNFVVECWVYLNASKAQGIFDTRATNTSTTGIALYLTSGNVWQMVINNTGFNVGGSITNSVWTHVAVVRTGTTLYVYVAGSLVNSTALSNNLTDTTFLLGTLRDNADATTTWKLNGYVDDLRITKGYNRGYTGSTITVPTAPFPLQ